MFRSLLNLVKTEPALLAGAAQTVLALLTATVIPHITAAESGASLAAFTAALSLVAAIATRPFQVSALTGFTGAAVTLLVAFGIPGVQPSIVATLNAVIVAVAMLVVRLHVTPVTTLRAKAAAARM
jgi:hypothetical protein